MSETAARLVIEAGRRHHFAVTSWASLEAIEEFSGGPQPGLRVIAERASNESAAASAAALSSGAKVAALLLQGIPAQTIAEALSRNGKEGTIHL